MLVLQGQRVTAKPVASQGSATPEVLRAAIPVAIHPASINLPLLLPTAIAGALVFLSAAAPRGWGFPETFIGAEFGLVCIASFSP